MDDTQRRAIIALIDARIDDAPSLGAVELINERLDTLTSNVSRLLVFAAAAPTSTTHPTPQETDERLLTLESIQRSLRTQVNGLRATLKTIAQTVSNNI